eukprot:gene2824-3509_t
MKNEFKDLANHKVVPLVINDEKRQKTITWYTCGPTVYDSSHLGHARTYVSVDIIQRILNDYFGYNVLHVMGMTDVDDKIINRSKSSNQTASELARKFEIDFVSDMKSLNIKPPIFTTRVSEHITNIIDYIKQIEKNELAYESGPSILFDLGKFGNERYEKLRGSNLQSISDENLVKSDKKNPGDFSLWKKFDKDDVDGCGNQVAWDSPFGRGRPGWHIECSAMIDSIFKDSLDIHSGGIDLEFPHHQNEIAQCEAHHSTRDDPDFQWVNYFLHVGHLSIKGQKMSKSLKNFISIREFLEEHKASTFRWMCLLYKYNEPLSYTPETLNYVLNTEKQFNKWFNLIEDQIKKNTNINQPKNTFTQSRKLLELYCGIKNEIEDSLSNDFDTPSVIRKLLGLMDATVKHINFVELQQQLSISGDIDLLYHIYSYVKSILRVFGFDYSQDVFFQLNLNDNASIQSTATTTNQEEETKINDKLAQLLLETRQSIKDLAKEITSNGDDPNNKIVKEFKKKLFKISDQIRDNSLKNVGLKISDQISSHSSYEWVDEAKSKF